MFGAFLFLRIMQNEINAQGIAKTPTYNAIIPAAVRYCKELCPNAKLLYGEITALSAGAGFCDKSNRYFADLYDMKRLQTISDWIGQLKKLGFITVELIYSNNQIDKRILCAIA